MRRPSPLLLPALASVLLLAACGTERADTGNGGPGAGTASPGTQVTDPGIDGVRVISVTIPSPSPSPERSLSVTADRLPTDSGISAAYEVTNQGTEAMTYTILVNFTNGAGEVMGNKRETVRAVGAGKTVRGTVHLGPEAPGSSSVTRAAVADVTKVPADEAPAEAGDCPASGVRVSADEGDAAMGLRVVGLHLQNCGTRDYSVNGYPLLELLDDNREPVDGVEILEGSGEITTGAGPDEAPEPVTLKPGERALASLVWRNTTEFGTPVNVPYVRVRAKEGADPVIVTPGLDLGTTGKLGVRPWKRAE
ncbi:hypothetical protein BM536_027270 [Streptomyces phaeoluteigriseus]|uniref:DUF4232 domain-containing protein n=1 Tax=Streptomyces phaeoluteigriseus TaxID=114686 RepID=A0A1V6MN72_9ACTN|nr:DUF4232 domain-containing protein [Streptomyces phaeoluteigriseus]OQD53914.1 hypothetical protein BM536_027270 [Streptomyces phaeoluteigriseus]